MSVYRFDGGGRGAERAADRLHPRDASAAPASIGVVAYVTTAEAGSMRPRSTAGEGSMVAESTASGKSGDGAARDASHPTDVETSPGPGPREALEAALGLDLRRMRRVRQVHSKRVVAVDLGSEAALSYRAGPGGLGTTPDLPEADGLLTNDYGLILGVTVADCMPILLQDRYDRGFALLHSGWRGTGILLVAVNMLRDRYNIPAGDLIAGFGPAIGGCCYRVDEKRYSLFHSRWGAGRVVDGRYTIDLVAANAAIAEECGVGEVRLESPCTVCNDWLGSYRRQGPDNYSLMLAVAFKMQSTE